MLSVPTTFPQAGAPAFLHQALPASEPLACRIIQHRTDGTVIVAIDERFKKASSTRTVAAGDLFATREEAIPTPVKGKRTSRKRAPARSAARPNGRPQAPRSVSGGNGAEDAAPDGAA